MNKLKQLTLLAFGTIVLVAFTACQKTDNTNATVNQPVNKAISNTNQSSNATAAPDGEFATPTAAYKFAYAARKNQDIAALKRVMSKDMFEFLTLMGQDDKKSVDDMLRDLCKNPQGASDDARNEKIDGNTATLEYLGEDGQWRSMDLVKEDGSWKLTIARPSAKTAPDHVNP